MKTRTLNQRFQPNLASKLAQSQAAKTRLLTAKHLSERGVTYCVSRESNADVYEIDNPALDTLLLQRDQRTLRRPALTLVTDRWSQAVVGGHVSKVTTPDKPVAPTPSGVSLAEQCMAAYEAEKRERERVEAGCNELAKAWIERIGLRLPADESYVDRFWPLELEDVSLAFQYYFACRQHAPAGHGQLFAGLSAGAPHILAKWYPPSFWQRLRSLGIEAQLRSLPSPNVVPALDVMFERLCDRYDHEFLYRWYRSADGSLQWSALMKGAPHFSGAHIKVRDLSGDADL